MPDLSHSREGRTLRAGWFSFPDRDEWVTDALRIMKVPARGEVPEGLMESLRETAREVERTVSPSLLIKAAPLQHASNTEVHARGLRVESPMWARVASLFEEPGYACALAVTLGDGLEEKMRSLGSESVLQAFEWDALASSLAEHLTGQAEAFVSTLCTDRNQDTTRRFSPGYCDWPLAAGQMELASFCRPETIGIQVSAAGLLVPRKSVTAVILSAGRVPLRTPCPFCRKDCENRRARKKRRGMNPAFTLFHLQTLMTGSPPRTSPGA